MPLPSIADLERAVAGGTLDGCLERVRDEGRRSSLRRALEIDRALWTEFPASLASCLLARTLDDPALSELHASWTHELGRRNQPWIRPLRALPIPGGLLAELRDDQLAPVIPPQTHFESDDVVVTAAPFDRNPDTELPIGRGRPRRWAWRRGELSIEQGPRGELPAASRGYPRVESGGWGGAARLHRSPGEAAVTLPAPPDASAEARFSADGRRLFLYGSLEDYQGGYLWIVDPATLAVQRKIATRHPVSKVRECAREDVLLLSTSGGLIGCMGGQTRDLLHKSGSSCDCLAPSGEYLAAWDDKVLRIWSTFELLRRGPPPFVSRIRTCFDPTGDRLLSGRSIFDGRTGQAIAEVEMRFGSFLEGGPASPWLSFGARNLVCIYNGLQVWDTRSGAPLEIEEQQGVFYPQWFSLAHDRAGTRFAALQRGTQSVRLHDLPSGRVLRDLAFSIRGQAIAISPDGSAIAVQEGNAVEVRSDQGSLLRYFAKGTPFPWPPRPVNERTGLRFSADGRRLARFDPERGWRIAPPDDVAQELVVRETELDEVPGFTPPRPVDWSIQAGTRTIFTHLPTGTPIAFPAIGPWVSNPAHPRILACDETHLELGGGAHPRE